jgi:kumamolisin
MHTHLLGLTLPNRAPTPPVASRRSGLSPDAVPYRGYYYETPASLACVYGLTTNTSGCNPNTVTAVPASGSPLAIAIVDAYHNPNIAGDLTKFNTQFGLPTCSFQVVYASGSQPKSDKGWSWESSLDVEYAHAMSPGAKLFLVEAASNSLTDLLIAVDKAAKLVSDNGGGIVSMSWGGSEFSGEASYDSHFQKAGVTFVASTGDSPGVSWPSISSYVVAAGGTSISRNPATGNFISEGTWQLAGAGLSVYVSRPSYQDSLSGTVGSKRGVPDIAAVADPYTGAWVYSGYNGGWGVWGGTSLAAPVAAGMMSINGTKYTGINGLLTAIYGGSYGAFRDVTIGNCGPYAGYISGSGWDLCTGRGAIVKP